MEAVPHPAPAPRPDCCPESDRILPVTGGDFARCPSCGKLVALEYDDRAGPVLAPHPALAA